MTGNILYHGSLQIVEQPLVDIDTVEAYMTGIMDADKALGRLTFYKPNNQICILNQGIIDSFFTFKGYIEI